MDVVAFGKVYEGAHIHMADFDHLGEDETLAAGWVSVGLAGRGLRGGERGNCRWVVLGTPHTFSASVKEDSILAMS